MAFSNFVLVGYAIFVLHLGTLCPRSEGNDLSVNADGYLAVSD